MKFATSILATAILLSEIAQARQELASKPNALHGNKHAFHRVATASRTGRSIIANPLTKRAGPHYCQNYPWSETDWPLDGYCEGLAYDGSNIECWRDNQCPIDSVDGLLFPCTWHDTHEGYASCDGRNFYTGYDSPPSSPEPQPARAKRSNNKAKPANARTTSKSPKSPPANKQRRVGKSKPRLATKSKKDQERVAKAKAKGTKKSAPAKNPAPAKKPAPAKNPAPAKKPSPAKKAGPAGKAKGPSKRGVPSKRRAPRKA